MLNICYSTGCKKRSVLCEASSASPLFEMSAGLGHGEERRRWAFKVFNQLWIEEPCWGGVIVISRIAELHVMFACGSLHLERAILILSPLGFFTCCESEANFYQRQAAVSSHRHALAISRGKGSKTVLLLPVSNRRLWGAHITVLPGSIHSPWGEGLLLHLLLATDE